MFLHCLVLKPKIANVELDRVSIRNESVAKLKIATQQISRLGLIKRDDSIPFQTRNNWLDRKRQRWKSKTGFLDEVDPHRTTKFRITEIMKCQKEMGKLQKKIPQKIYVIFQTVTAKKFCCFQWFDMLFRVFCVHVAWRQWRNPGLCGNVM